MELNNVSNLHKSQELPAKTLSRFKRSTSYTGELMKTKSKPETEMPLLQFSSSTPK